MRDDLLDPLACVQWAKAQLDIFSKRIDGWIDSRPYTVSGEKNPQTGNDIWQIDEVEPLPKIINAEAGAIINSARSSLDLLASKLAERNGHIGKKDVYFPVCLSTEEFQRFGRKKIKRLAATDQYTIERLQPYNGGDVAALLWTLHDMDVTRKHRALVHAYSSPHGIGIYKFGTNPELDDFLRGRAPDEGYTFPREPADPNYHIQIRIEVSLGHTGALTAEPIAPSLHKLCDLAEGIIRLFNVA
jgi:hypothetical protein